MLFKLQFENSRGQNIDLFGRPFRLSKVEGLGDVGADIQLQRAPYQDGASLIDATLEPRRMTIELKIYGKDAEETEKNRRTFASVFNPKLLLGKLKYIHGENTRIIEAAAESVPFFPDGVGNRGDTFQKAVLYLICPDPYWQSLEMTEEPAFEALFEFPSDEYWELEDDGDLTFEMGMQRNDRIIINDGDAPAPFRVDFYGPSDSPVIENLTTGEFIKINKRLEENQVLKIDTSDSSAFFVDSEGVKTDVFNWVDLSSTFFSLILGENDITCRCAISNNQKDFDVYYGKLYNAV